MDLIFYFIQHSVFSLISTKFTTDFDIRTTDKTAVKTEQSSAESTHKHCTRTPTQTYAVCSPHSKKKKT